MAKFGEYALEGYLKAKQMKQEQEQFNQQMATQERRDSLLNMVEMNRARLEKRKLDWQMSQGNDQLYEVKEGTPLADVIGAGTYPIQSIDDIIGFQKALLDSKTPKGNRYQDLGKVIKDGKTQQKLYDRQKDDFIYEEAPEDKSLRPYPSPYESYKMFAEEREFKTAEKEKEEALKKEERKRIQDSQQKLNSLTKGFSGGKKYVTDPTIGKREGYLVNGEFKDKPTWKAEAENTMNALLEDTGLKSSADILPKAAKYYMEDKGIKKNFDKLSPEEQRQYMYKTLASDKETKSEDRKILKQWINLYKR